MLGGVAGRRIVGNPPPSSGRWKSRGMCASGDAKEEEEEVKTPGIGSEGVIMAPPARGECEKQHESLLRWV